LYWECRAGTQINFRESGRGLGDVTPTIFGSMVGYPSDSLASCAKLVRNTIFVLGRPVVAAVFCGLAWSAPCALAVLLYVR